MPDKWAQYAEPAQKDRWAQYAVPVQPSVPAQPSAPAQPPQEGFWESLGHTFGIGKQEAEQNKQDFLQHPILSTAKTLIGGPALQAAQSLGSEFMRSTGQAGQAVDAAKAGNPYAAEEHGMYAVPFVGGGIQRGVDQLGPNESINPAEVGTALGTSIQAAPAVVDAMSPVVRPIAAAPGKILRGGANILAGTGPKAATELVEKTTTGNEASQAKAAEANTKIQSKRVQQVQQHFEDLQQAREKTGASRAPLGEDHPLTPAEQVSRRQALERGVEQLDPKFQEDLKATGKDVRAQANEKYNAVRAATAGETVPSESLATAVKTAEGNIQGSSENLKVFRDILSKHPEGEPETVEYQGAQIPKGHPLYDVLKEGAEASTKPATFSDLQGYYTELGSKLAQGNLPGDVFRAMQSLQGSIGDLMQNMAESKGVGDQLTDARSFYRDYMAAFRDSKSPLYKAMNATERGKSIAALRGADQSGIQTLARYNPDLAQRANTIRGYQAEAKSLPSKTPAAKPVAPLPPKTPPVLADVKKIGLKDIQQAKQNAILNSKGPVGGKLGHLAGGAGAWHVISSIMYGNPEGAVIGGAVAATPYILGKVLRTPSMVRLLSTPTPADIAAIPPEIRANMPQIVKAAQANGIKVHPALLMMGRPNAPQQ